MRMLRRFVSIAVAGSVMFTVSTQAQPPKAAAANKKAAPRQEVDPVWAADRTNGFAVGGDMMVGENGLVFADGTSLSADNSGLYFENPSAVPLSEGFSSDPATRGWTFETDNPTWGLQCWWDPSNQTVVLYHTTTSGGGAIGLVYRGPARPADVYTLSARLAANHSDVETASLILRVWNGDTQVRNHAYGFDYTLLAEGIFRATFTGAWDRIEIGAAGDWGPFLIEADDVTVQGSGREWKRIDVESDPHAVLADGSRPMTGPLRVRDAVVVGPNTISPEPGMIRFDPSTKCFEGYNGTGWVPLGQ